MPDHEDAPTATAEPEWISGNEAARRMGIAGVSFRKVAATGAVRRRQYPGLQATFSAEDVRRLIDRAVTTDPASTGAAE